MIFLLVKCYTASYFLCGLIFPFDCSQFISYSPQIAFVHFSPHQGGFVKLHHKLHPVAMNRNLPAKRVISQGQLNIHWRSSKTESRILVIYFAAVEAGGLNVSFRNHQPAQHRNTKVSQGCQISWRGAFSSSSRHFLHVRQ